MIVTEKIEKELMQYPNIAREIKKIQTSGGNIDVFFHNGSSITVVPNNENARGVRAQVLVADEAILLKVIQPRISRNRYRTRLELQVTPKALHQSGMRKHRRHGTKVEKTQRWHMVKSYVSKQWMFMQPRPYVFRYG